MASYTTPCSAGDQWAVDARALETALLFFHAQPSLVIVLPVLLFF
jgi:hypothetical protein